MQSLIPTVVIDDYDFHKTTSGRRGGELIVRGSSPRLKLSDRDWERFWENMEKVGGRAQERSEEKSSS